MEKIESKDNSPVEWRGVRVKSVCLPDGYDKDNPKPYTSMGVLYKHMEPSPCMKTTAEIWVQNLLTGDNA